jgi:hypothetical protein
MQRFQTEKKAYRKIGEVGCSAFKRRRKHRERSEKQDAALLNGEESVEKDLRGRTQLQGKNIETQLVLVLALLSNGF